MNLFENNRGKSNIVIVLVFMSFLSAAILTVLLFASFWKKNFGQPAQEYKTSALPELVTMDNNKGIIAKYNDDFYISTITDEIFAEIDGISFNELTPVTRDELRYIHVLHCGIDGKDHEGELIVNKVIAQDILQIFYELYIIDYPIEKMVLVDNFHGNDDISMTINNTSAFNSRYVSDTDELSLHAYGLAVDVNPLYNPYVGNDDIVLPNSSRQYVDRTQTFSMKMDENDICVRTFVAHGFTWGGDWTGVKDYMHFEYTDAETD